ncbi:hypothetical protein FYJ44_04170 [Desulfovibrio sp. PG-178-WT-4]|uniref:Glycosyltransferase n=1 Tax=Desulfovibrio porci TaxID=2605782 RepID=A0A6L5XJ95_9BACT|nr:hypothetical protein [Desulfovibrio porci]MSS27256.1 hypothetical protein [Desulfovibrio porci]
MVRSNMLAPLLELLESSMTMHGWAGRMFGVRQWLRDGSLASMRTASVSVVVIRRNVQPSFPCDVFELLKKEEVSFQSILVDIPEEDHMTTSREQGNCVDAHLVLSSSTPWYTAFNLGAACAGGDLLVFLNGAAMPQTGLLAAYREMFQAHPETLAARGVLHVTGLEDCACQVTGSFALADETVLWPVDLDENMAVRANIFFALGGFDESLIGGYGALDLSIRLFGCKPDFCCQRYAPRARIVLESPEHPGLPLENYLMQRQRAWLQLNDSLKRYLDLYGKFWLEHVNKEERQ